MKVLIAFFSFKTCGFLDNDLSGIWGVTEVRRALARTSLSLSVKIRDEKRCPKMDWLCVAFMVIDNMDGWTSWTTNKTPEFWICAFEDLRCAVWPSNFWSWYKRSISSAGACQMVASVHCFLQAASSDSLGTQLFWGRSLRASAVENLDVWPLKIGFDLHEATSIC